MPSPDAFVRAPAAWKKARESGGHSEGAATILAIEVLSPGDRKTAVRSKVDLYCRHGIEAWIVNSKLQEIEIFRDQEVFSLSLNTHKALTLSSKLASKLIPLSQIFDLSS